MKTPYNEIVNIASIGSQTNPISLNEILRKANDEQLTPAAQNKERVLFLGIDVQQDFMDNGALGVPGAHGDVERMTQFIYNNMDKITNIAVSIDTHTPHQIFHPCWWIDENGNNPAPYTPITLADLDSGKYRAVIYPRQSRDYVEHLEKDGKKTLCVWSYHCLQGTSGAAFENQFANMIYFHSVAKKAVTQRLVKGQDPLSEMYGIIKPEYDTKNYINIDFLNKLENYDKIIIAGEAKSHIVIKADDRAFWFTTDREYVFEKKHKSPIYAAGDSVYFISPANTLTSIQITKSGNGIRTITKCGYESYFAVSEGHSCVVSRFAENLIVNLDGKNIEIPYTDTVNNYGIHRDKITGGWLIVLENGAGQFFTFVCNEHGVAYSEDRIKYQCGLGNVCFYNSNISIPIDGNIRIYSYQKQAFKDFECEAVSPDSCLIKDSTAFTIVNDENIYRLVRTAR